jgi:high-affinity iron transporter
MMVGCVVDSVAARRGPRGRQRQGGRHGLRAPRRAWLAAFVLAMVASAGAGAAGTTGAATAAGVSPETQGLLAPVADLAARSLAQVKAGDGAAAAATLEGFEDLWSPVEDGVRAQNLDVYARVEVNESRASAALAASPARLDLAATALEGLRTAALDYQSAAATPAGSPSGSKGLAALVTMLGQVKSALADGDMDQAQDLMGAFQDMWPLAEGEVQTRSARVYAATEDGITKASALLLSGPGSRDKALDEVGTMLAQLEGLTAATGYSAWDAGLILLREGMEALLVIAALLAALKKAGTPSGARWVWAGAGTGIAGSAVLAVILVFAISAATAGTARESMEGFVGLASVLIMLTVGAWLHSRSSLQAWNGMIKGKVGGAIAGGRIGALYFLALFAVLREGAEATVFYIGIAQGIGVGALLLGIGTAALILLAVGFLLIRFSVRLPLHWVFLVATVLIYYLAFKITGESVRALQAAAILPSHFVAWLPSVRFLGITPTLEVVLPQVVVLALVLSEVIVTESRRMKPKTA